MTKIVIGIWSLDIIFDFELGHWTFSPLVFSTILIFILILSILVLVHEFGHFLAAKLSKVKVEEFGLGLPPRLFGFQIGETFYSLNLLPIGGFVRLAGEETGVGSADEFSSKGVISKSLIVIAGVLMNFVLGFILLSLGFTKVGMPEISQKIIIDSIAKGSPAQVAGLMPGDQVIKLDGQGFNNLDSLTAKIKEKAGTEAIIVVERMKRDFEFKVIPRKDPPKGEGALGVRLLLGPQINYKKIPFWQAPKEALIESWNLVGLMFSGLKNILGEVFVHRAVPQDVVGPVGIAKITGEVAKSGFWQIINFLALLSFNLGVVNLLPFPGLDGGRLLFVLLERILGSRFSLKIQTFINSVGVAVLLALMVVITYYDIVRSF